MSSPATPQPPRWIQVRFERGLETWMSNDSQFFVKLRYGYWLFGAYDESISMQDDSWDALEKRIDASPLVARKSAFVGAAQSR